MHSKRIVIPGAAGLVGQNLILLLKEQGYANIIAIDKHPQNTATLRELHPDITVVEADISREGEWQSLLQAGDVLVMLQAQIGSKASDDFVRNNIRSTELMLETANKAGIEYLVHISSSVVESVADDDYTNTKKEQERMVLESGLPYCVLRPTLMFGWFDSKHLGWLSRFMQNIPVFPIPGHGRYMRQPLYVKDFCKIIIACVEKQPANKIYDITGKEEIDYVDIIREIRKSVKSRTFILHIPYRLFWILLKVWAVFDSDPPFTADQLKALVACDEFDVIDWDKIFDVKPTPFAEAIKETFQHPVYSKYILKF
ncbi:MAG: NAD-dependent epimerase/dehydratase family protein [Gammaproteobacteria bacterium]